MTIEANEGKNPIIAAVLNFLVFGGVGYLYMGQKTKGIWGIIYSVIVWVVSLLIFSVLIWVVGGCFYVCCLIVSIILMIVIIGLLTWFCQTICCCCCVAIGYPLALVPPFAVQALFAYDAYVVCGKLKNESIEDAENGLGFLGMLPGFKPAAE